MFPGTPELFLLVFVEFPNGGVNVLRSERSDDKGIFLDEGTFYGESMVLEVRFTTEVRFTMKLRHGDEATRTRSRR